MPFRLLDYRVRVYRRFPNKAMRQIVIYLKQTSSERVQQTSFDIPGTHHEFEVVRLWEQPVEGFLLSPGLLPFAVLSQTNNREGVLREVAQRINRIDNRGEQNNITASTALLAGLVLRKELIQRVLRQEMIQESVIYQEITAEAEALGIRKGEISLIVRLLKRRIGEVTPQQQAQIEKLSVEQLEELGEALLDFERESDLLAWLESH